MTKYILRTEQIFLTSQSYSEETQTLIMEPDCKRLQRLSCLWFCVRWRHQDFTILHFQKSGSRQPPPPPHMHPLPIDPLWLLEYKLWHDSEHGLWNCMSSSLSDYIQSGFSWKSLQKNVFSPNISHFLPSSSFFSQEKKNNCFYPHFQQEKSLRIYDQNTC